MASGTSISILYLAAKEIRKKKEMHTCSTHSSTFLQDQLSFDGQELWHFFEESCSSSTVAKNQEEPRWVNVWLSFGLGKQIILVFFAQSFVLVLKHLVKRILKRYRYYSTNQAFLLKPKMGRIEYYLDNKSVGCHKCIRKISGKKALPKMATKCCSNLRAEIH